MRRKPKEKKTDYEALNSHFMQIPRMDTSTARDLIDLGFQRTYELAGRSPEVLFDQLKRIRPDTQDYKLPLFRLAVYFAEEEHPDPKRLKPEAWFD